MPVLHMGGWRFRCLARGTDQSIAGDSGIGRAGKGVARANIVIPARKAEENLRAGNRVSGTPAFVPNDFQGNVVLQKTASVSVGPETSGFG